MAWIVAFVPLVGMMGCAAPPPELANEDPVRFVTEFLTYWTILHPVAAIINAVVVVAIVARLCIRMRRPCSLTFETDPARKSAAEADAIDARWTLKWIGISTAIGLCLALLFGTFAALNVLVCWIVIIVALSVLPGPGLYYVNARREVIGEVPGSRGSSGEGLILVLFVYVPFVVVGLLGHLWPFVGVF